jgi:plastocyanin
MRPPFLPALLAFVLAASATAQTLTVRVRDAKGAAVPDAVVSLTPAETQQPGRTGDTSSAPVEIVQRDQEYVPYVTVIRTGTVVEFPNADDIQHHIYSVSKAKRFEKPLYAPGAREAVLFDQPGIVTLGCNIHDWMIAYIVVLTSDYFAKSDADGLVRVSAPPGNYRLDVWHPRLTKPVQEDLTLADGDADREFSLTLKPDRRIRRAPEAKAGGY